MFNWGRLYGNAYSSDASGDGPELTFRIIPGASLEGFNTENTSQSTRPLLINQVRVVPGQSLSSSLPALNEPIISRVRLYGSISERNITRITRRRTEDTADTAEVFLERIQFPREGYKAAVIQPTLLSDKVASPIHLGTWDYRCLYCGAKYWAFETNSNRKYTRCCGEGKIILPPISELPTMFAELFEGKSLRSKLFFKKIRLFNSNTSFASTRMKEVQFGPGVPVVSISGSVYHALGPLQTEENAPASFLQCYFYDSNKENNDAKFFNESERALLNEIRILIKSVNHIFRGISSILVSNWEQRQLWNEQHQGMEFPTQHIVLNDKPLQQVYSHHCYALPSVQEVCALIVSPHPNDKTTSRQIQIQIENGPLKTIPSDHASFDPLCYPIFFPHGDTGWTYTIRKGNKGLSPRDYYRYRFHSRDTVNLLQQDSILCGRQLSSQYIVDMFAKIEEYDLKYIRLNQKKLKADLYNNLQDALTEGDENNAGRRIILPSSFKGSPRNLYQEYLDGLAIVRKYGKPSLFITMTCNPDWEEIKEALNEGEKAWMRPDIVERVWNMKKKIFLDDIVQNKIFGEIVGYMYVVEWQKRSLPHMHLLLILSDADEIKTAEVIDEVVSAEIPDPEILPDLHELVVKFNLHGPCGPEFAHKTCMQNDKCTCRHHFPFDFCNETFVGNSSYPTYKRRAPINGGQVVGKNGFLFDNRWVVPYNAYLTLKYRCHINVEICSSFKSVKYTFKYILKGPELCNVGLFNPERRNIDEISEFVEARYINPNYGIHRIFEFETSFKYPNVYRLQTHLPDHEFIIYEEGHEERAVANKKHTMLTAYFSKVTEECLDPIENPSHGVQATDLTYQDFPMYYVWQKTQHVWTRRAHGKKSDTVGRLYNIRISSGDVYYTRMLLTKRSGVKSFDDLRTVDGVLHPTFKDAARSLGLLDDDNEWIFALREAAAYSFPRELRKLFVTILTENQPTDVLILWEMFKNDMSEDKQHERCQNMNDEINNSDYSECLHDIDDIIKSVRDKNEGLCTYGLPLPTCARRSQLSHEEEIYDIDEQLRLATHALSLFNTDQAFFCNNVLEQICLSPHQRSYHCAYLDAPGGTGKTFCFKYLLCHFRSKGIKVLPVGSSAISAILLPGGRTAHSGLKIPIPVTDESHCNFTRRSNLGKKLLETKVILWDEILMMDRKCVECVDRSLKALFGNDLPFGGIFVIFGGDCRQILPVLPKASKAQIIYACLQRSYLMRYMKKFTFVRNERVLSNSGCEDYCNLLLRIGEGKETVLLQDGTSDCIRIPETLLFEGDEEDLINWVHPDPNNIDQHAAILSAWNEEVNDINQRCLHRMEAPLFTSYSCDKLLDESQEHMYPIELLNSLTPPGFPLHNLEIKVGAPIILLRNLRSNDGLCNGTRLIANTVTPNLLTATIQNGSHSGNTVFIPRICFSTDETIPFQFTRRQFPVKLAFALTINKSQGQTLTKVGIYLPKPIFNHGGLYVALSRVTDPNNVKLFIKHMKSIQGFLQNDHRVYTKNIVYREIISVCSSI